MNRLLQKDARQININTCRCNIREETVTTLAKGILCNDISNTSPFLKEMGLIANEIKYFRNLLRKKDIYTMKHSFLVGMYAFATASCLGLEQQERNDLYIAGVLHDVGKLYIPNRILNKVGPLDCQEYQLIKMHPLYSHAILAEREIYKNILTAVTHHHEHHDGSGYPHGLRAGDIPFYSRILAVADAFEAMTSNRPYRKANCIPLACAELKNKAGSQFDPVVVNAFLELIGEYCRCPIDPCCIYQHN